MAFHDKRHKFLYDHNIGNNSTVTKGLSSNVVSNISQTGANKLTFTPS